MTRIASFRKKCSIILLRFKNPLKLNKQ